MAKSRKPIEQRQGNPTHNSNEAAPSGESLGDQLIREARAEQAEFVAGWKEFMEGLGIQGKPIGARNLREMLLREGINPADDDFSLRS